MNRFPSVLLQPLGHLSARLDSSTYGDQTRAVFAIVQNAFTNHLRETEKQVTRLEQVFRSIGEKPRGKQCDGIIGIVEEASHAMEELEGSVLDAALIAGAQKVEHYEIASYGTLAYFAKLLGNDQAKDLLGQTLEEEKAADEDLSDIAKSEVNRDALLAAGTQAGDGWETNRGAGRMSLAHDRPSVGRSTKRAATRTRRSSSSRKRSRK